jgi:hypothetical protein
VTYLKGCQFEDRGQYWERGFRGRSFQESLDAIYGLGVVQESIFSGLAISFKDGEQESSIGGYGVSHGIRIVGKAQESPTAVSSRIVIPKVMTWDDKFVVKCEKVDDSGLGR